MFTAGRMHQVILSCFQGLVGDIAMATLAYNAILLLVRSYNH